MSTTTKPAPFAHLTDQAVCDVFTDVFQRDVTGWATSDLREDLAAMKAAPELLAALVSAVDILERLAPPIQLGTLCEEQDHATALRSARAAIAKATR